MAVGAEASVMLYDGSPFAKGGRILFDYAEKERFTHFGTSAKFIDACAKRDLKPAETHDLAALRMVVSTGAPLVPAGAAHLHEAWENDAGLSSISASTDIMGAVAAADAELALYRGDSQRHALRMS